jgi:outer membrane receptor protein involved in Fe transport
MAIKLRTWRVALLAGCATAALATALPAAAAAEGPAREYAIGSQDLDSALRAFAMTSGHDVVFDPALVRGRMTAGVNGAVSDEAALRTLLEGTELAFEQTPSGGFVVRAPRFRAAETEAEGGTVEALIVTAQKREEDIQDVPIAISAFTQEDLTRSQVAGGPDLITQVPNMTFTKTNFSSYSVQLRGIGTQAISATTDPAVAVAFNNTPFIRNRFFEQEFYDLQRVEVLRGPQGTLYGRNATAGVVNIISAKPKFVAEAKLSGDVSNFNSSRIEGMLNIPLVEDKVALRVAGAWTKRDGYATNELTGNPIDGRDLWSTRVSLRVSPNDRIDANLIWEHFEEDDDRLRSGKQLCKKDVVTDVGGVPITNYYDTSIAGGQSGAIWAGVQAGLSQGCRRNSLYAQDSFQRPNGLMLPYYVPLAAIGLPTALTDPYVSAVNTSDPEVISATNDQPEDLRVIESTIDPTYRAEADIGELQISFDLTEHLTLQSETGYGTDVVYSLQDFNRFNTAPGAWEQARPYDREGVLFEGPNGGIFCDPQLGCSDRLVAVDISTAKARQFSQELRLSSDFEGSFNFSLGANYLRADSEDKYYVFFNSLSLKAALGNSFFDLYPYENGVTDNVECLDNGYIPGDLDDVYPVTGCIYIDPNPIDQVNDEGHNYFLSKNPYKLISYAVFGEAYYQITDAMKVTAGLRWTVDKKDAPRIPTWVLGSNSVGYPVAEVIEQEWREPTGRLAVDWKPDLSFTDETMLYASYAHGYKAGGANPPGFVRIFYSDSSVAESNSAASATRPRTFDPEFVDAYELGAKNTLADGRVVLNLASFYYDYTGYQVSEIVDRSAFNRNFDATVWGVEFEADWRPFENLRLGLKGGYEDTRIADGEEAIDLMDRTAGDPDWLVVRPFPTYASSCILPTYVFVNPNGTIGRVGGVGGGGPSGCEIAYAQGRDPVTDAPYVDLTQNPPPSGGMWNNVNGHPGYPGFDPSTAPNNGEGIAKQLGGNELPNAPNWTWTITGDYTVPLPAEWLMTLHTDLHWQAESWWRVFNDHEYNKLDEYFTMNLAAIFTNEDAGWNVMAYIKNVTDETAITGAFLNSDDTGLTTNVFLTEPRLYGLRVTKNWHGHPALPWLGGSREGPYPLTLELGGQVQRFDASNDVAQPGFGDTFPTSLEVLDRAENSDLDWGDGRNVKLTYRPGGGLWSLSGQVRFGKTNGASNQKATSYTDPVCVYSDPVICEAFAQDPKYAPIAAITRANNAQATVFEHEEYTIVDFAVGRDVGFGGLSRSTVSAGLRQAEFSSLTKANLTGVPDWDIPNGFIELGIFTPAISHTVYKGSAVQDRDFEGLGPHVAWEASYPLVDANGGQVDLDWAVAGGVLFGKQHVSFAEEGTSYYVLATPFQFLLPGYVVPPTPVITTLAPQPFQRSADATVPSFEAALGVSYKIGGFTAGAGYRWERYFDAIDGGFEEHKSYDRTIDGPYFKLSVGFGG